jgi:hypothetical protein
MLTTTTLTNVASKTCRHAAVFTFAAVSLMIAVPKPAQALVVSTTSRGFDNFLHNKRLNYCFQSSSLRMGSEVVNEVDKAIQRAAKQWSELDNRVMRDEAREKAKKCTATVDVPPDANSKSTEIYFVVVVVDPNNTNITYADITDDFRYYGGEAFLPKGALVPIPPKEKGKAKSQNLYINKTFLNNEGTVNAIMVHEIGHILGFRHEFARPTPPEVCKDPKLKTNETALGTHALTDYDPLSVMNYKRCSQVDVNLDSLSKLDQAGISYLMNVELRRRGPAPPACCGEAVPPGGPVTSHPPPPPGPHGGNFPLPGHGVPQSCCAGPPRPDIR